MTPAAGPASASPSGKRTLQGVDGTVAIMNGVSNLAAKGLSLHLGRAAHPRSFLRVRIFEAKRSQPCRALAVVMTLSFAVVLP